MLELRIKISTKNIEKVIRLIKELVEVETEGTVITDTEKAEHQVIKDTPTNYLNFPPVLEGLPKGRVVLTTTAKYVGSWGQFNSFFPVKAVLRILAHMMKENGQKPVILQALVDKSIYIFRVTGLQRYRGFPKKANKVSAVGRFVWHFINTAHQIGLIKVEGNTEIPARGWDKISISITEEGCEFAKLDNRLLDWNEEEQVLTDTERKWIIDYLKKVDAEGYKDYSFLGEIFEEFTRGNTDISAWLEENPNFNEYIQSWSRKKEKPKEFRKQLRNMAIMFAQSRIALLRELGVISNRRGNYRIIGSIR